MGHHGVDKTLTILKEIFYWPHMRVDIQRHCSKCITCLQAKSKIMPHGLYTPLPIVSAPGKTWDEYLPHVEFSFNKIVNRTANLSPFEVIYRFNPLTPFHLLPFSENSSFDS